MLLLFKLWVLTGELLVLGVLFSTTARLRFDALRQAGTLPKLPAMVYSAVVLVLVWPLVIVDFYVLCKSS